MEKIKIIIVDDHEIFRTGLKTQLNEIKNYSVIGEASNGVEFLELLETKKPDIVFMDIKMPEMDGIKATEAAVIKYPKIKIIALSMFGDAEYLQAILNVGAKGFLLKNVSGEEICKAVETLTRGFNYFSKEMLSLLTDKFLNKPSDTKTLQDANLSKREVEVLKLICQGYTNVEIGKKLFLSQRTVDGHRAKIIKKTGTKNTVNLVIYAIKNKLIEL